MNAQWKSKNGEVPRSRGIQWCDQTHNRTGGCMHECVWMMPDGSRAECYAKTLAEKRLKNFGYPSGFEHHYFRGNNAGLLKRLKDPSLVFVDSMSDLFGHWVPEEHTQIVLEEAREAPQHICQALTKNAPGILTFAEDVPENFWLGVSSPPDEMWGNKLSHRQQVKMLERQLKTLAEVKRLMPDRTVWMSIEPLSWDISKLLAKYPILDWAVIGAATNGPTKYQPAEEHVANVLAVLDEQEVPVFFKGNLKWSPWREDFPGIKHPALKRRQQNAREFGWTLNTFAPSMPPERRQRSLV